MHERWAGAAGDRPRADAAGVVGAAAGGVPRPCARRIGAACLLRAGDVEILIDFPAGEVRAYAGEPYGFRFDIDRPLVEKVVAERAVDWSNSLFLSCRFRAWREGEFNEYVYNFFKSLSPERMRRTEAEALRKLAPADGDRARHRARRLGDAAPLPAPQRRPQRVRRGRRLRADVHAARLALRPRDRPVPHQRRPRTARPPSRPEAICRSQMHRRGAAALVRIVSWRRGPRRGCASA